MQIMYLNSFNTFFLDVVLWILGHLRIPETRTEGQSASLVESQINLSKKGGWEKSD